MVLKNRKKHTMRAALNYRFRNSTHGTSYPGLVRSCGAAGWACSSETGARGRIGGPVGRRVRSRRTHNSPRQMRASSCVRAVSPLPRVASEPGTCTERARRVYMARGVREGRLRGGGGADWQQNHHLTTSFRTARSVRKSPTLVRERCACPRTVRSALHECSARSGRRW
jgi:hypothetical protein